jgi:hypothetical protein
MAPRPAVNCPENRNDDLLARTARPALCGLLNASQAAGGLTMKLYSQPIVNLDPLTMCHIWQELTEALYGVNGFGGRVAEIYSYRFQKYTPGVHASHKVPDEREAEIHELAAMQLVALCDLFCSHNDCQIYINSESLFDWSKGILERRFTFSWRVHIEVCRPPELGS